LSSGELVGVDDRIHGEDALAVGGDRQRRGQAITVADACAEAKEDADYVTTARGGRGAVREAIELILRAQGSWQRIVERYRKVALVGVNQTVCGR